MIKRCYWPLLHLCEAGYPVGIELTGYTLEEIQKIDPAWVETFRHLLSEGKAELIGSGLAQIIGPLVPPEVTAWNLKLGAAIYQDLLGVKPLVALVNEQAYTPGLVPIYKNAGYEALMLDWADAASYNPDWSLDLKNTPQLICGEGGQTMPVLWSDAMTFQKFQRFAHGELSLEEYSEFITGQIARGVQALPLYTSDAEVFDYRPGRFGTEAELDAVLSEWERISLVLEAMKQLPEVSLQLPGEILRAYVPDGIPLSPETAEAPVLVKKQRKYNILRWAVTGRDDLKLNTLCWRAYEGLRARGDASDIDWRALCLLWASDYRTHITECRWRKLPEYLQQLNIPLCHKASDMDLPGEWLQLEDFLVTTGTGRDVSICHDRRFVTIQSTKGFVTFNLARGCAIQAMGFGEATTPGIAPGDTAIIGTLGHGYFDDISLGADFYSGHLVVEPTNGAKITDLAKAGYSFRYDKEAQRILIRCMFDQGEPAYTKYVAIDLGQHTVTVRYEFSSLTLPEGVVHAGFVTLNPEIFKVAGLHFESGAGGQHPQFCSLVNEGTIKPVSHARPVSRLVSASGAIPMTDGMLKIGDLDKGVVLQMHRTCAASVGMIESIPVRGSFFLRGFLSLQETDETSGREHLGVLDSYPDPVLEYTISLYQS
ncbi:glycoside hydrolase [Kordiimonas sediminis]|uniref:Glycoside hydrolase n=1 Tax=Kordiimonas sediminis TaxID=1735581 RepID=A0A919AXA2_9PROT|nr:glycoside hydrolase family 57 [Kordiimonas sediminis]GHF29477.1 glycoside hydrolase [Kordiimonas sediminis]